MKRRSVVDYEVEVTTLASGLVVVTDRMPWVASALVGVWVNVGGRDEDLASMGVSHFLEHMAFKGTARRSASGIAEAIEDVGGYLNAHTGHESTAFHARVLAEDVPLAVDVLGDILTRPTLDPVEIEKEKTVVFQEFAAACDTPSDVAGELLMSACYPDQPMGRSLFGDASSIRQLTRDGIARYMDTYYRASSMVLVASGAVDHDAVVALATEHFYELGHKRGGRAPKPLPAVYLGGVRHKAAPVSQVHLAFGFRGPASVHEDYYAAQITAAVLGGGSSSRLFQKVREEKGLCYGIDAFVASVQREGDDGIVGIYAATDPEHTADVRAAVAHELEEMAGHAGAGAVEQREVSRAVAQVRAALLTTFESPAARAGLIATFMLAHGRPPSLPQVLERYESVDVGAVRRFAEELVSGNGSLAAVGPAGAIEAMEPIGGPRSVDGAHPATERRGGAT